MPERAYFGRVTLGAEAELIVPMADVEQRVIITLTAPGNVRLNDSVAGATGANAYVIQSTAESYYLGPWQALYASAIVGAQALSVYVAPTEDDYLESGKLLWQDDPEDEGAPDGHVR